MNIDGTLSKVNFKTSYFLNIFLLGGGGVTIIKEFPKCCQFKDVIIDFTIYTAKSSIKCHIVKHNLIDS